MDVLEEMDKRLGRHSSHDDSVIEDAQPEYSLPRDHISVSQVKRWLGCGKQYEFYYIEGKRGPYNADLARGSAVHQIIEELYKYKMKHDVRKPPEDVKDDIINEQLKEEVKEVDKWSDKVPDADSLVDDAKALATLYWNEVMPDVRPRYVEQRVHTRINGRIPFVGYVDLIEITEDSEDQEMTAKPKKDMLTAEDIPAGDAVRDIKVTSRKKSQADTDDDLQLTMYAELLDLEKVGFHNLAQTRTGTRKFHNMESTRSEGDRVHAINIIEDAAKAISQGVFPKTNPGDWRCDEDYCSFFDQCRGKHLNQTNEEDQS